MWGGIKKVNVIKSLLMYCVRTILFTIQQMYNFWAMKRKRQVFDGTFHCGIKSHVFVYNLQEDGHVILVWGFSWRLWNNKKPLVYGLFCFAGSCDCWCRKFDYAPTGMFLWSDGMHYTVANIYATHVTSQLIYGKVQFADVGRGSKLHALHVIKRKKLTRWKPKCLIQYFAYYFVIY